MTLLRICLVLAVVSTISCSPAASGWRPFIVDDGRFKVSFPDQPKETRERDGRQAVAFIASSKDSDGYVFEAASFNLTSQLFDDEREQLVGEVLTGITARPDKAESTRGEGKVGDFPSHTVTMELKDGTHGLWHVFYPDPQWMMQLSVVGPPGDALTKKSERFFASFKPRISSADQ